MSAVLSFLNKDSDTEVVATPRAVTLDNQTATLAVTKAFPILQITPGSANSPAGVSITYTNLGSILYVTPRIAADNNISMKVIPELSNIDSKDEQIINGEINTANIYAIRRIETSVMIPSGHTLVMGGLVNDSRNKSYTKVPILGDLPFVGLAFRKESKSRIKQNLLIFITRAIELGQSLKQVVLTALEHELEKPEKVAEAPISYWANRKMNPEFARLMESGSLKPLPGSRSIEDIIADIKEDVVL